jgi:hypothetical protein
MEITGFCETHREPSYHVQVLHIMCISDSDVIRTHPGVTLYDFLEYLKSSKAQFQ